MSSAQKTVVLRHLSILGAADSGKEQPYSRLVGEVARILISQQEREANAGPIFFGYPDRSQWINRAIWSAIFNHPGLVGAVPPSLVSMTHAEFLAVLCQAALVLPGDVDTFLQLGFLVRRNARRLDSGNVPPVEIQEPCEVRPGDLPEPYVTATKPARLVLVGKRTHRWLQNFEELRFAPPGPEWVTYLDEGTAAERVVEALNTPVRMPPPR